MKNILLVSMGLAIVFSVIALVTVFANENNGEKSKGDMIIQREAAIKIGSALLEESVFAHENNIGESKGDMIIQRETAIKIGSALLEEHFPDDFKTICMNITAEEKDGIWKVYNVHPETTAFDNFISLDDGKIGTVMGGELFVEFRKDNGEIIKIGIND